MQKNLTTILNLIFLIVVAVIFVILSLNFLDKPTLKGEEIECVDVNHVNSFIYDVCYDSFSRNLFMEVSRSADNYELKNIEVSFFDSSVQRYDLNDVPGIGSSKFYKIPSEKNPQNIGVVLDVVKTFSAPVCISPRELYVKYCPARPDTGNGELTINPITGEELGEVVVAVNSRDSDTFSEELVRREAIWKSQCASIWECSLWESCEEGVQKRNCKDIRDCQVPTEMPPTTRYCDGACEESWSCEWSACEGGFTVPQCVDANNCGTYYEIPQKIECGETKDCSPNVECNDWSSCEIDYRFNTIIKGVDPELEGVKYRLCEDQNSCISSIQEVKSCAVNVDIYTKQFNKCGVDYVQVYNSLSDDLLARVDVGTEEEPAMNIFFDNNGEAFCDYCFDGILSGDETGIDCGGSCISCSEKYSQQKILKETFLQRFNSLIKQIFT